MNTESATRIDTTEPNANPEISNDDFLNAQVVVEDRQFGSTYPVIQWVNGQPDKLREGGVAYRGGFFYSSEAGIEIPGFEPYQFVTKDGDVIDGFAAVEMTFVPIRMRRSWLVTPEKGLAQRYASNEFDEASEAGDPRGVTHLLVKPKGCDDPAIITLRGYAAKSVASSAGKDRGIIPSVGLKLANAASRIARKAGRNVNYPLCAFEITIAGEVDEKGVPVHTEVGSQKKSKVCLPVWKGEPVDVDQAVLKAFYVGNDMFKKTQEIHAESEGWYNEWNQDELSAARARISKKPAAAPAQDGKKIGPDGIPF